MPSVYTTIEIASPPCSVRAIFLDFDTMHHWHKGMVKRVEQYNGISNSDRRPKDGFELKPGDRLYTVLGDGNSKFFPTVLANNENKFRWRGKLWGLPGIFTAEHIFQFAESKEEGNVGGTTFVHAESFWGILNFMMRDGSGMHTQVKEGFEGFNKDLKTKCESMG